MPIYEYICGACEAKHETMQKLSDKPLRKCPNCGANKLKKALSLSGFQLKGSGWYKDGYAAKAPAAPTKSESPASTTTATSTDTPKKSTETTGTVKEAKKTSSS